MLGLLVIIGFIILIIVVAAGFALHAGPLEFGDEGDLFDGTREGDSGRHFAKIGEEEAAREALIGVLEEELESAHQIHELVRDFCEKPTEKKITHIRKMLGVK